MYTRYPGACGVKWVMSKCRIPYARFMASGSSAIGRVPSHQLSVSVNRAAPSRARSSFRGSPIEELIVPQSNVVDAASRRDRVATIERFDALEMMRCVDARVQIA
jgi:hypothetical protein